MTDRYVAHLMSGRRLLIYAESHHDAERQAIVWHQNTDAVEVVNKIPMMVKQGQRGVRLLRKCEDNNGRLISNKNKK